MSDPRVYFPTGDHPRSVQYVGSHTLYVRARNSRGLWGPTRAIPFDVLQQRFIAGASCGLGGASDTAPTGTTYSMDPVNYPFDSAVEDLIKTGLKASTSVGTYRALVRTWDSLNLTSVWAYAEFKVVTNGYYLWAGDYGLSGASALPDAAPAGGGVINAIKYACNMNPTVPGRFPLAYGTGTSGVPNVTVTGTAQNHRLRLEYVRRKDTNSITYQVLFTGPLATQSNSWQSATGPETVIGINSDWERVRIDDTQAVGNETKRFGKVQMTVTP